MPGPRDVLVSGPHEAEANRASLSRTATLCSTSTTTS